MNYHIDIFHSEDDEGYIADIPDLQYCSTFGDNLALDAIQSLFSVSTPSAELLATQRAAIETASPIRN